MSRCEPPPFVGESDQIDLTLEEHAICARQRHWIKTLINERSNLRDSLKASAIPANNWSEHNGHMLTTLRRVEDGGWCNRLRDACPFFTGYILRAMSYEPHYPEGPIDEFRAGRTEERDRYVALFRRLTEGVPAARRVRPPRRFGEAGWLVDEVIVNHDTCAYQARASILHHTGLLDRLAARARDRVVTVVEIGGGYGALSLHLMSIIGNCRYVVIDLPESLLYSSIYLSVLAPHLANANGIDGGFDSRNPGFTFVPNYRLDALMAQIGSVDLFVNTLSMSEMSADQVNEYCGFIAATIADDGVFFEQNHNNRPFGINDAKRLIAPHFPHHAALGGPADGCLFEQGFANLWANSPKALAPLDRVPFRNHKPIVLHADDREVLLCYKERYFLLPANQDGSTHRMPEEGRHPSFQTLSEAFAGLEMPMSRCG